MKELFTGLLLLCAGCVSDPIAPPEAGVDTGADAITSADAAVESGAPECEVPGNLVKNGCFEKTPIPGVNTSAPRSRS